MFCLECGADMVSSTAPITERIRGREVCISGIEHLVCPVCGEYSLTAAASRELSRRQVEALGRVRDVSRRPAAEA